MKRLSRVCATKPAAGMPLSMICGATGSCTSSSQQRQTHLPRMWRCTKNCAGTTGLPFAHVLAHAHHRLAAIRRWAAGVLGLVLMFDTHQVFGQRLALGAAPRLGRRRIKLRAGLRLQGFELGLQAGLVGGPRLLEQLALLGVHAFGLGRELPCLQARQLEGDALELGVLEFDGSVALGNLLALLADALEHLCGHLSQRTRAQTVQVLGFEFVHIEHARIVQSEHWRGYPGMFGLLRRCRLVLNRSV